MKEIKTFNGNKFVVHTRTDGTQYLEITRKGHDTSSILTDLDHVVDEFVYYCDNEDKKCDCGGEFETICRDCGEEKQS